MSKKKILYIEHNTDGTVGGSHFSLLFLVEGLNKKLYSPVVIFYQENQLLHRFKKAGCKVLILRKIKPLNFLESFRWLKNLSNHPIFRFTVIIPLIILQKTINYLITFILPSFNCWYILQKEKFDLVHFNNTLLRPQQWIVASIFTKTKIIAHERGINTSFPLQSRFWAHFLKAVVCISDAVKNNLIKHAFSEKKLVKIYNGLDPDKFIITKSKEEVLRNLGVDSNCHLIGIVGNIKQWKGQEIVIRSMKHVRELFQTAKCLIIGEVSKGDVDYLAHLESIIKSENLKDCIIFTGQRNDIPDLINSLTVLVHASISPEPFGRVLLEGMALEKPVISTNIGAGPEIVEKSSKNRGNG
jgi:glycosyltransferase involved in cell wall biosynthesis